MFKHKIVYKLTAGYVLIVLISLLIIGIFFISLFRQYSFENKQANMVNRAREIAQITQPYLLGEVSTQEYNTFITMLDSFVNAQVLVTDREGKPVVSSKKAAGTAQENGVGDENFDQEMVDRVLRGEEVLKEVPSSYDHESVLAVGVPVYAHANNVIGAVFLYSPVSAIVAVINRAFVFLLVVILLAIILTGTLSFYFSTLIAKPLSVMNHAAIEMARGNYNVRTNLHQKDEAGQLASSLDLLASKLEYTLGQLSQERDKLKDILASISEGILAFDAEMRLVNQNEAVKSLLGYDWSDNLAEEVRADLRTHGLLDEFKAVMASGEKKVLTTEWSGKRLKFYLSPVKTGLHEIVGAVALIQDISESERLEQMRKDFIANVSHEFRTPLTLIRGSAEALVDGAVSGEEMQKYCNRILQETKGLERMIGDLLDLSRLQSGKIDLNLERIDMTALVKNVARSMQVIADKKGIAIATDIKDGESIPPVLGDYDRLRQILIIFLDNAIKYSHENTVITISLVTGEYVYLRIKDRGVGIPQEDIPYVWERFYKVDRSRRKSDTGTGLGLAIAKHLIELHQGIVRLKSELNKGTVVEIGLPYVREE